MECPFRELLKKLPGVRLAHQVVSEQVCINEQSPCHSGPPSCRAMRPFSRFSASPLSILSTSQGAFTCGRFHMQKHFAIRLLSTFLSVIAPSSLVNRITSPSRMSQVSLISLGTVT